MYLVFAVIVLECHVKGWKKLDFDIVTLATDFPLLFEYQRRK